VCLYVPGVRNNYSRRSEKNLICLLTDYKRTGRRAVFPRTVRPPFETRRHRTNGFHTLRLKFRSNTNGVYICTVYVKHGKTVLQNAHVNSFVIYVQTFTVRNGAFHVRLFCWLKNVLLATDSVFLFLYSVSATRIIRSILQFNYAVALFTNRSFSFSVPVNDSNYYRRFLRTQRSTGKRNSLGVQCLYETKFVIRVRH